MDKVRRREIIGYVIVGLVIGMRGLFGGGNGGEAEADPTNPAQAAALELTGDEPETGTYPPVLAMIVTKSP